MQITLYTTTSDRNMLNKELQQIKAMDVKLKDDCTLLNPVFEVSKIDFPDISKANYCFIPDFGRYYYIGNPDFLTGGIVSIPCGVDVLMSNRDEILNIVGTVKRSENLNNGYLLDNEYNSLAYTNIVTKSFPNSMIADSIILLTVG